MKLLKIRWLVLISIAGAGLAGVITSNVGCGSDNGKAGSGGSGGGGTSGGGTSGGGTGGGGVTPKLVYNFDTATASDSTSWKLNDYVDATPAKNLGSYMHVDAGLTLADPPVMEWVSDDSESSTSSGSMKISVTFTDYGQYVDPVINLPAVVDLTGRTLTMKVRLVSGMFSAFGNAGVQFHFSTTSSYTYGAGEWVASQTLMDGAWHTMHIPVDTTSPAGTGTWDPTMVIQVGVQITAGSVADAGAPTPGRLVFEIDTFKG
jgi:hypothetical protein